MGDMREINDLINRMRDTDLSTRRHALAHELRHAVAAIDAAEARAVKPLVWNLGSVAYGEAYGEVSGVGLVYHIWKLRFLSQNDKWLVSVNGNTLGGAVNGHYQRMFDSVELAQDAAHADYETRILSALAGQGETP